MIRFLDQKLYHISEDPNIEQFEPRPDRHGNNSVWAISTARVQNYLFPRDCPRICIWADAATLEPDRAKLSNVSSVIAIEQTWFQRTENTKLYAYCFDSAGFTLADPNAGYFTSTTIQTPIDKAVVEDPLRQLNLLGARLEILAELHSFREMVLGSSFAFSMIRMRNAAPIPPTPI
ncbi:DUF6886 family protein [Maritalea sp.]|uniref:DUF6886 family protein n=1 Tax=Maritalea sp. TaxID=2003361 RepID=UPI0039E3B99B